MLPNNEQISNLAHAEIWEFADHSMFQADTRLVAM